MLKLLQKWYWIMTKKVLFFASKGTFVIYARIHIKLVIIILQLRLWSNFSYTIHLVCVIFIHFMLFKFDSKEQIFEKRYCGNLIYYQSFCQKNVVGEIFFHISFWWRWLSWGLNCKLMSCKSAHYLLDYLFIYI